MSITYIVDGVEVDPHGNAVKADLAKLTKDELVALATDRGLETDGTKADIIARLEGSEQGD